MVAAFVVRVVGEVCVCWRQRRSRFSALHLRDSDGLTDKARVDGGKLWAVLAVLLGFDRHMVLRTKTNGCKGK